MIDKALFFQLLFMKIKKIFINLILTVILLTVIGKEVNSQKIKISIIQINDVYEIGPIENGRVGGLSRVSTQIKKLKNKSDHLISVLSGDFFSPSIYNRLSDHGKKIQGAQMVDVLNAMQLDYATFGNHEFDIAYSQFQSRLNESNFEWISTNTKFNNEKGNIVPFYKNRDSIVTEFKEYKIIKFANPKNLKQIFRVGILGFTLPSNKATYVHYDDVIKTAKKTYNEIKDSCDIVIAMTHQSLQEDIDLANAVPGISLLMGGHEHQNILKKIVHKGSPVSKSIISKADANVRTVYHHILRFKVKSKKTKLKSKLIPINDRIQSDLNVKKRVQYWTDMANQIFKQQGFDPLETVYFTKKKLDGLEQSVRNSETNLGKLIAEAMKAAGDSVELAILNSGSIRLDDFLTGTITQYDILRTLPFGGKIISAEVTGKILVQILNAGIKNKGTGGFLQTTDISFDSQNSKWLYNKVSIIPEKKYRVAFTDYLLSGKEKNLEFLNPQNPEIRILDRQKDDLISNDIRMAVTNYLKKLK